MSKQLKYKLKKTLKNAEFVHADLEYHQQLSQEAMREFTEEVNKLLAKLSPEDQQKIQDFLNSRMPPIPVRPPEDLAEQAEEEIEQEDDSSTEIVPTDIEPENESSPPKVDKDAELKKLFRRIAEHTHPDKAKANGFSDREVSRMLNLFIRAKEAQESGNWYILYSIAIELGLEIDDPTEEEIEWIEEDIKGTLAQIANLANLTAWHWYLGDEGAKKMALKFYFLEAFGFDYPL
tara:strand:- start:230 stop:931 length:702 start_codon:yes stop_codon:yes gene_type:complete